MKTHPKSLPAMARRVPVVRPRDERLELPPVEREPGRLVAAICIGVCAAAVFLAVILEVLHVGR